MAGKEQGETAARLSSIFAARPETARIGGDPLPAVERVERLVLAARAILFPGFFAAPCASAAACCDDIAERLAALESDLAAILRPLQPAAADRVAKEFISRLPDIATQLHDDVDAAYDGDPAAASREEIIFTYPGLKAVAVYRLAHVLLNLGVPLLPRLMAEIAHAWTGIDIHPGAQIGRRFFIDHGSGVVVGETCEIGANVKLYQGVTLGAVSFGRDADGNLIRQTKRHPTLEDDVVVYANATILGGKTVIGRGSIIGSSVWLNHTVSPGTVVTLEKPLLRFKGQGLPDDLDFQI